MKNTLTTIIIALILISCNREKNISENVLEDIQSGDISYLQGTNGPLIYDSKSRLDNRLLEHLKAENWEYVSNEMQMIYPENIFYIPQDIKATEFIKEWTTESDLFTVKPYSKDYYQKHDYLEEIYGNYEDFKKSVLTTYKQNDNYEINESKEVVRFSEKIKEARYSYRITAFKGTEIVTICMYQLKDGWKVGAIFRKEN
jgi:hypothetical protein